MYWGDLWDSDRCRYGLPSNNNFTQWTESSVGHTAGRDVVENKKKKNSEYYCLLGSDAVQHGTSSLHFHRNLLSLWSFDHFVYSSHWNLFGIDFFEFRRHESFITYTSIMLTTAPPPSPCSPPHISNKLNHATFHNAEKFIVTVDGTSKHRVVPPTARFRPAATQFSRPQCRHYTDRAVRGTKFNLCIPVTLWESVKNNK